MRTFSHTIEIAASPARVWTILSDVERWPEWTASMTRVERLDRNPIGVGSRIRVKQPKLATAVFDVTSWTPERGFDWITRNPAVTAVANHIIEPADPGCRVTLSVTFSGPLSALVAWLYGGLTERYIRMEAEGLKRIAE
jgi:hypothetical protein